ncbi:MAG: serine/threonine protein kinase [Nocardioides sp.]|uniref:serine/threonine-protein kinase n=1 Tax=Nocardioides sp. TaxID=35761 RepID=UPI00262FBE96|nr:serine/threonine-protein kinase [Nocardioides sp.]MCW2833346.1 serine/threonine protein kinase [Nocardioides sp.]
MEAACANRCRACSDSLVGYSDLREIGVGGGSVVYHARENSLGREAAIKALNVADEVRAARFAREVEITLVLGRQHPNIVTVLATGITGSGRPAIVMEFCPDGTLHDRLKQLGPLPVEEVVRVGLVLADALSFAHGRGVLHRDVKPQNVLVLPTSRVLADFGIARLADSEHTGSVETFTYRHASPQVLDGHAPTAADDIWSLGSTLSDGEPDVLGTTGAGSQRVVLGAEGQRREGADGVVDPLGTLEVPCVAVPVEHPLVDLAVGGWSRIVVGAGQPGSARASAAYHSREWGAGPARVPSPSRRGPHPPRSACARPVSEWTWPRPRRSRGRRRRLEPSGARA